MFDTNLIQVCSYKLDTFVYVFISYLDGQVMYALDEDKVCRATAQLLLQNAVKFNLSEFQEVWQQSVPDGMTTRLDQLRVRSSVLYGH